MGWAGAPQDHTETMQTLVKKRTKLNKTDHTYETEAGAPF